VSSIDHLHILGGMTVGWLLCKGRLNPLNLSTDTALRKCMKIV